MDVPLLFDRESDLSIFTEDIRLRDERRVYAQGKFMYQMVLFSLRLAKVIGGSRRKGNICRSGVVLSFEPFVVLIPFHLPLPTHARTHARRCSCPCPRWWRC